MSSTPISARLPMLEARERRDDRTDRAFRMGMTLAALTVLALLLGATISMLWGGREALASFGLDFFTTADWDVGARRFGALVPIYGTVASAVIALLIAVPVSFGIAVFLTELAPAWLRNPIGTAIELLAGVPSIIYGMWGLFVLAPMLGQHVYPWINDHLGQIPLIGRLFQGPPLGIGMLTAGLVLAIMVIPFIASVMREVFLTVPYTRSAVIGGVFLGLGRALGETMAVTFVIGNAYALSAALLEPGSSIASTIANEFAEAVDPLHRSALLALGFVLFLLTFVVLALARLMLHRLQRKEGR